MSKVRLDKACIEKMETRTRAKDAIQEGRVLVNGKVITKASYLVDDKDVIEIQSKENDFVSRAGQKLQGAFDEFNIQIENQVVLDIGASTGGFTDVCLRHGAKKVYALDVGHLQLSEKLEKDDRVIKYEGKNAREIKPEWFDETIDFMCMDVSFISCKTILEVVFQQLNVSHMAILVKPQFECGPEALNKHGVLRNDRLRSKIIEGVKEFLLTQYKHVYTMDSVLSGRSGNQEAILYAFEKR